MGGDRKEIKNFCPSVWFETGDVLGEGACEWRIDWGKWSLEEIEKALGQATGPVLLTERGGGRGGALASLWPDWQDVEWDAPGARELVRRHPAVRWVVSYHNEREVPHDLDRVYAQMREVPATTYKIAAFARSGAEALRLLAWARDKQDVSAIPMGPLGQFGRVLGPVIGNRVCFFTRSCKAALHLGQMGAEELFGVYRADRLNRETARFGLIGSPVDRSIGHLFHNRQLEELNGVYVKIDVKREEADGALAWLKELGFLGLSVTMPLKEWAAQQVEAWEGEDVGAVNTLWLGGGKVAGKNTDGEGALDALEAVVERVAGKRVWIFGSGGTARAVAYEARKRGAEVWIGSGRQAEAVAKLCGARVGRPDEWEVAINCTPASPAVEWKEGQVAMDVVYSPRETPFLTAAKEKGCQVVYGEEMFVRQAEKQLKWWREKWGRG